MSNQRKDENENGRKDAVNWLSDLARVYGGWHLTATMLQGLIWACFVVWNETGQHPDWRATAQASGTLVWQALPGFSIISVALLVIAQKGGRFMLTFIDERRQRLTKEREEGRDNTLEALSEDPRIAAIFREDPRISETLRKLGIDPPDSENGGG